MPGGVFARLWCEYHTSDRKLSGHLIAFAMWRQEYKAGELATYVGTRANICSILYQPLKSVCLSMPVPLAQKRCILGL